MDAPRTLDEVYPPSPAIAEDVIRPTGAYRARVLFVLVSLAAFLVLYFGLIAATVWGFFQAIEHLSDPSPHSPFRHRRQSDLTFFWIVAVVACPVLFLFLVKVFFRRGLSDNPLQVEITEREQPLFFAFLRRLCDETKAPFPHRVFMSYEVNAAVFYQQTFWSLFIPGRKNLVVGLGLINRLNLSEFKAVLAHEFGHFSQSSMKLGAYVYSANRTLGDLVYGRDWLDDILAGAARIDLRIAVFVWAFLGILWVVRKCLELLFKTITFAHSALSRQMEFNADLVAYRMTGSDALAHALAKMESAEQALNEAVRELFHAADHKLYTRDLFLHQTTNLEHLRKKRKDPTLGKPAPLPADPNAVQQLFEPGDRGIPLMWATHPSNYDRERNLKARYVRVALDERPSWLLFADPAALREEVTRRHYKVVHNLDPVPELQPAEEVQAFFDAEHAETTYGDRYHGFYDEGYVGPGDLDSLGKEALTEFRDLDRLAPPTFDGPVKERVSAYAERRKDQAELYPVAHGLVSKKTVKAQGGVHPARSAASLLVKLDAQLEVDRKWFEEFDKTVFKTHYAMAHALGGRWSDELLSRYRFQIAVQDLGGHFHHAQTEVKRALDAVAGQRNLEQNEFQQLLGTLRWGFEVFITKVREANNHRMPPLKNMEPGQLLGTFLWPKPIPDPIPVERQSLGPEDWNLFFAFSGEAIDKIHRIRRKSLGGLLAFQEELAAAWAARPAFDVNG